MDKQYMESTSGTFYSLGTNEKVIDILERCRYEGHRIRVVYGDIETGKSWEERHDIEGRIGRSTGLIKVPLLIHNKRSLGGPAILTHCIVGIRYTTSEYWLFKHPLGNFDLKGVNL